MTFEFSLQGQSSDRNQGQSTVANIVLRKIVSGVSAMADMTGRYRVRITPLDVQCEEKGAVTALRRADCLLCILFRSKFEFLLHKYIQSCASAL